MNTKLLYSNVYGDVKLSFVITTYKRDELIYDAINSIIHQPFFFLNNIEILVISNDPEDLMEDLISVFSSYPISIYVNEENYGMIANVNLGIQNAKGEYIAFLHDDDFLLMNYLAEMMPHLDEQYDCLVPSRYHLVQKKRHSLTRPFFKLLYFFRRLNKKKVTPVYFEDCIKCWEVIYCAPSCGVIFSKKSLYDYGLFKDKSGLAWDFYNFREYNKDYKIGFVHEIVSVYRYYTGVSNNPHTKKDFFDDRNELLNEQVNNFVFLKRFYKEINFLNHKIIEEKIPRNICKYAFFILAKNNYYIKKWLDLYIETTNKNIEKWWEK